MALNVFGTPLNMTYSGTGESGNPYVIESTNHSVNTTGEIIFQTTESGTIFPNLAVDSEIASDVAGLFRNTIPIWQASGQDNFSTSFRVLANDQIKVNYIKDGAGAFGDDNVTGSVYFVPDPPEPLPEVAIVMVTQPVSSLSGSVLATQPSVKIVDVNGDIVPGTLISVTVGAVAVTGTAVASGTLTVEPVSGNVVFTDLIITGYGSYYLSFTAAGLTPASSNTITFVQDPGNPNPPIPVKPKRSYIPASVPNSGDMETNEFAINVTDKKGYVRDSNGIVHLVFDGNPTASGVSSVIAGTGITVDTATGDVTVTNSEPDQVVTLTNGTAISATGTYPDFTITNDAPDQIVTLTDGTAISVTGTYPDFTITNSLPDQTVTLTEGTDITITGTYPDFTIGYSGVAGGVTSIIAGTGISVDVATGDVTVTNDAPDQTVSLTNGTAISVTGAYPDFTITNDSPDQIVTLTDGTAISVTGTYPDFTITNDAPDQIVSITSGTGINATGTYPDFTIDSTITQYTDSDARLALSAGTGISYDNATGIITNSEPDQTVSLTDGTGVSVTGTYPNFTIATTITQYTDSDARLSLSAGTGISYDNTTGIITNDAPDQTVTLTQGTDITITGTYPDFTIGFSGSIPTNADADTAGIVYGLTTDNVSGYNVSLGFGANGTLTTGIANVAIGGASGDMTSGSYNVAIGFDCNVADPTADKQLAIGPDAYVRWLTGDSSMNIKPGAGIKDASNSLGTSGQILSSTGTAIQWVGAGVTSIIAGTGVSVDVSTGAVTVTNSSPDQTVSLTNGTGISVTGSYPSFTIATTITQYTDTNARKSLSAGTGISYDNATGIITNSNPDQTVSLANGTGISVTGTYPSFTITNSLPDQTVSLTDGTAISVTGTYPSFTITNNAPDQTVSLTDGTGITVTGTYPSFTITNSLPDQTVSLTDGTDISVTGTYPNFTISYTGTGGSGTVTSVDMSVPTGLLVSGNPVTTTGTLAVTFDTGYSIPTTSSQTTWDTAYTNRITSLTTTGSSGSATLTTNTLNIPTYTLSGLGGQASSTNLTSVSGLTYVSSSFVKMTAAGTFSLDTTAYGTGSVTSVAALTLGTTGTDLSSTVATGTTTPVITLNVPTASALNRGALSSSDWSNFNTAYTNRILSLTTTGSSGSATLATNTLNVPTYTLAGLGGIKLTDLSSSATGLTYTNTTGAFSLTSGYSIPTTTKQTQWDTSYTQTQQWNGGATNLVAATGRTSLGATTVGGNMFTLTNPTAVTFPRFNLDNTVSALDAATFRTAIGAGTSSTTGTVTSIATTSPITGGTITGTGTIGINATSANTASYVVQRDASGNFSAGTITAALTGNASTATSLAGGGAGQVPYNTGSGATSFLAAGTAGQVLQSNGSSAPSWASVATGMPTGAIIPFAAISPPTGYLLCDGSAISRSTYATLFSTIIPSRGSITVTIASPAVVTLSAHGFQTGDIVYLTTTGALPTGLAANTLYYVINVTSSTFRLATSAANAAASTAINTSGTQSGTHTLFHCPYGLGNGSTTFNVPDLRSRIPINVGQGSGLTNRTLGGTVGAETVALSTAELASHNHTATDSGHIHTASSGNQLQNHQHALDRAVWTNSGSAPYTFTGGGSNIALQTPNTGNEFQVHQHSITVNSGTANVSIGNSGSGSAHNNMQPSIGLNFIIKT